MLLSTFASCSLVGLTNFAYAQGRDQACTIIVDGAPGILKQNGSTNILSLDFAGGLGARAQIIAANGRYRASVDKPTGFSNFPNDGNKNTEFSASFSSNGATDFSSTPHNIEKNRGGTSNIEIHFEARRVVGSFPAGNYSANVTLRCE